jgi:hypothetical protein
MATPIQQLKGTAAEVAAKIYAQGLLVWNETAKRWHGGDGVTAGGIAMARFDERNDGALGFEQRIETDAANAVTVADLGRVIIGNRATAIAFNLAAASSLTSKFVAGFKNSGAGAMSIVPNGTELIDGVNAAITLPTGASVLLKCDGTGFRTYFSNVDVTGTAINTAAPLTGANLADGDKLGVFDVSAAALVSMTISQFIDGIFKAARTIANAQFASASFKLFNAAGTPRALSFDITALTADRQILMPNRNVDLSRLPLFALLQDQKSSGTNGGTPATTGSWQTRTLNTEVRDPDSIVSLSGSDFTTTVPCIIRASAAFYQAGNVGLRVYDVTNAVEMFRAPQQGTSVASGSGATPVVEGFLPPGTYRLQYLVTTATTNTGLGVALSAGTEVYASVSLQSIVT